MRPRWWRQAEDVPGWATSRGVQVFGLVCICILIAGIVSLYRVRISTPEIRPLVAALLTAGICLLAAWLVRTEQVRRHRKNAGGQSPER
jgi:Flp pilus assembly protein TadB